MNTFKLSIVTPDGEIFSGEAVSVNVKTDTGNVQIMRAHADYLAALGTGIATLKTPDGNSRAASASGGFISVSGGEVRLVATTFEFSDEIDLERAKRAKEKAEAKLSLAKDEREIRLAKAKLARALSRIGAAALKD